MNRYIPTERDAREGLRQHLLDRALAARQRYGPHIGAEQALALVADRAVVRYPATICFDGAALRPGEFGFAEVVADDAGRRIRLYLHDRLTGAPQRWPLAIAYHIPPINYHDIATHDDCVAYGACLLGLHPADYQQALAAL
ncbi:MAG: hypothetical protein ACF8R7_09780 [Phycisphaerales bacterium JB039]